MDPDFCRSLLRVLIGQVPTSECFSGPGSAQAVLSVIMTEGSYLFRPQGLQVSASANVQGSYLLQVAPSDNYTGF